jgi:hypothetical protein
MSSGLGHRILCALVAAAASLAAGPAWAQDHPLPATGQYPSLKISGFGDVDFGRTSSDTDTRNFTLGQLALHMISELSPRVTFFGEISFTPRSDAGTGTPATAGFNVEVERMILRFDRSDRLKVSFGRYHTPVNYWNTAFHHGQWLQTTITRPEMIRFGSQFLPVHFIGGLVEGSVPAAGLNLNYKAGIGNGRAGVIGRAGDAGDANENVAWLANVFVKPDRAYGLEVGASVYGDAVERVERTFDEQIVSGYVVWHKEAPELIAEVAAVRHRDPDTSLVTWSQAYYVQAAWRLGGKGAAWKPYVRFEHVGVDSADLVFTSVPNLDMSTLGARYDLSSFAAIKGEYRTWRRGGSSPRDHGGYFQLAFTF